MSRLTEEMVIARAKNSDLALIKKLNCWGSDLVDISIVKRMRGVEVLALSVNRITSLAPFEDCKQLQELYLRKNNIQNLNEIAHLQTLPVLKYLWLEENPCCERAGPNYRSIVLRALPNLKKLDNIEVTQEEVDAALRNGESPIAEDEVYEDACDPRQPQQRGSPQQQLPVQRQQQLSPQQQQEYAQPTPRQQQTLQQQQEFAQQASRQQQPSPPDQAQSSRGPSPSKEPPLLASPLTNDSDGTITNNVGDLYSNELQDSMPPTPTKEPVHPPSPKYNTITKEQRTSFHQYDSPGSDQESPLVGYREVRPPHLPPSISTHSMKEYYQSERPAYPAQYRHSQNDLTEWEENHPNHPPQVHHNPYNSQMQLYYSQRRSAGPDAGGDRYAYRNGNTRDYGSEWEEDRPRSRRRDSRYNDFSSGHRRTVSRPSNLLSATLCLINEMDCTSLETLEHAVRRRIDELLAGE